jgi:hypothetical protein
MASEASSAITIKARTQNFAENGAKIAMFSCKYLDNQPT